jgi:hypothetical protein
LSSFGKHRLQKYGVDTVCKKCRKEIASKYNKSLDIPKKMIMRARKRARKHGFAFNVEPEDIVIPERCPVFDVVFSKTYDDFYPSLDRKDSKFGYEKGNVAVISQKANRIKSDATIDELRMVLAYMKNKEVDYATK